MKLIAVLWNDEEKIMVQMDSRIRGRAESEDYEFGQLF